MDEARRARRFDPVSTLMVVVTLIALGWAGWLRFGPAPAAELPGVGMPMPPLRLIDPATSEPLVLLGLRGRIVWLVFWSPGAASGASDLAAIERVWSRLKDHPRFTMVAAAVDPPPRPAPSDPSAHLPVYQATPETRRAFGATDRHLPLHVLVDETGRVGAVSQGMTPAILERLTRQAEDWLDTLQPLGKTRFARGASRTRWRLALGSG